MKTIIKNTATALGNELMDLFLDFYGDDIEELDDLVVEALLALKIVKKDREWNEVSVPVYQEVTDLIQF